MKQSPRRSLFAATIGLTIAVMFLGGCASDANGNGPAAIPTPKINPSTEQTVPAAPTSDPPQTSDTTKFRCNTQDDAEAIIATVLGQRISFSQDPYEKSMVEADSLDKYYMSTEARDFFGHAFAYSGCAAGWVDIDFMYQDAESTTMMSIFMMIHVVLPDGTEYIRPVAQPYTGGLVLARD